MTDNRRKSRRIDFEGVDFASLEINGAFEAYATIVNISRGGLLLELFPMGPTTRPARGDAVRMLSCPEPLGPLLGDLAGRVVWVQGQRCGIRFDRPLEAGADALRRLLYGHDVRSWSEDAA